MDAVGSSGIDQRLNSEYNMSATSAVALHGITGRAAERIDDCLALHCFLLDDPKR